VAIDGPVLLDAPLEDVVRIRLNRPSCHNAINEETVDALADAVADTGTARCVVIGSAAPGMFCSGADVRIDASERTHVSRVLYTLYRSLILLECPVIAAVDGPAVGGGAQLALACDVRIASPMSYLRFVGPAHGLAVGAWGLASIVGRGTAMDLCLSGRAVSAVEAAQLGLVARVTDAPMDAALAYAQHLIGLDRSGVSRVKRIVHNSATLASLEAEARGNDDWDGRVAGWDADGVDGLDC
jgi:enoyl-CoA hydratase/carnithine racemase